MEAKKINELKSLGSAEPSNLDKSTGLATKVVAISKRSLAEKLCKKLCNYLDQTPNAELVVDPEDAKVYNITPSTPVLVYDPSKITV